MPFLQDVTGVSDALISVFLLIYGVAAAVGSMSFATVMLMQEAHGPMVNDMQYFALLISQERDLTAEEGAAEMAAYGSFHAMAASAIRGGDALLPAATAVRITGGPDAPIITDGPFAEGAEVAGGYYVFEAENLDDALTLARKPARSS